MSLCGIFYVYAHWMKLLVGEVKEIKRKGVSLRMMRCLCINGCWKDEVDREDFFGDRGCIHSAGWMHRVLVGAAEVIVVSEAFSLLLAAFLYPPFVRQTRSKGTCCKPVSCRVTRTHTHIHT